MEYEFTFLGNKETSRAGIVFTLFFTISFVVAKPLEYA